MAGSKNTNNAEDSSQEQKTGATAGNNNASAVAAAATVDANATGVLDEKKTAANNTFGESKPDNSKGRSSGGEEEEGDEGDVESGRFGKLSTLEWLLEPGNFKLKAEMRAVTAREIARWFQRNLLLVVTFSGVSIGVLAGLAMRPMEFDKATVNYIAYPGELFMRLLRLMILPLIIASLITGAASLNAKMNGKIALRTIVYFLATSLVSALIGLALVTAVHPGSVETKERLGDGVLQDRKVDMADNFMDLGRNLFPDNLFKAAFQTAYTTYEAKEDSSAASNSTEQEDVKRVLAYRSGTNTLGIIFFCLTFGTVLGSLGPAGEPVVRFFAVVDEVIMRMVYGIMWVSPVGIGSVICAKILSVSQLSLFMSQLALFIVTVVSGIFLYQFTVLQLIYLAVVRKNPFRFWWDMFQSWMTAFATASTAAALPVTFSCMDKAKVDRRISKFVLPIGATVNMDGTALFVTVASIFIAQMNNKELAAGDYVTVVLTATAASIASASVPSAALVLMLLVLTAIDVPYQDVSLLWAIDWFVDRCRTTNNLLGDCYGAAVVEALSRDDLRKMDEEKERKEREEAKEKEAMGKITVVVEGGSPVSRKEDNDNNGNCNGGGAKKINNNLEGAQGALKANWSQVTNTTVVKDEEEMTNMSGVDSPCGSSVNGSSVEVPAVIVVDNSGDDEDDNNGGVTESIQM